MQQKDRKGYLHINKIRSITYEEFQLYIPKNTFRCQKNDKRNKGISENNGETYYRMKNRLTTQTLCLLKKGTYARNFDGFFE